MQFRRNELLTGMLVIGTVAVIVAVLILLGAPGLFRPLVTYKIYFDNAAGIKQVDNTAIVYRDAHTRLMQLGLLGEMAIDITSGTEASGRAHDGEIFAGERTPDFSEAISQMLEVIKPVASEATTTMKELEATAQNLSHITDENSELNQALAQFKTFGEHLVDITSADGSLTQSLDNIQDITEQLTRNDNLQITLQNFRQSSEELKSTLRSLGVQIIRFQNICG